MQAEPGQSWLIYALGGGLGHLNRAVALARAAGPYRVASAIITNCHYADLITASTLWQEEKLSDSIEILQLPPGLPVGQVAASVASIVFSGRPRFDRFIVDTFARGLAGELPEILACLKPLTQRVLIARDLEPKYVKEYAVEEFVNDNFELVINPGERESASLAHLCHVSTAPWLVRNCEEFASMNTDHCKHALEPARRLVVISCAGKPEDLQCFGALADCLEERVRGVQFLRLFALLKNGAQRAYWPGIDIMAGADAVVGAAGYNTVSECRALGVPLIAVPQPRLYDRQRQRALASATCIATNSAELVAALNAALCDRPTQRRSHDFNNGATQAAQLIYSMNSCPVTGSSAAKASGS